MLVYVTTKRTERNCVMSLTAVLEGSTLISLDQLTGTKRTLFEFLKKLRNYHAVHVHINMQDMNAANIAEKTQPDVFYFFFYNGRSNTHIRMNNQ